MVAKIKKKGNVKKNTVVVKKKTAVSKAETVKSPAVNESDKKINIPGAGRHTIADFAYMIVIVLFLAFVILKYHEII